MAITYIAIATVTVGSGGASSIDFTSIPGTYTDLLLLLSSRQTATAESPFANIKLQFNGDTSTSNYSARGLFGSGSAATSGSYGTGNYGMILYNYSNAGNTTTSTFANNIYYIPNYTSSNKKSVSIDSVTENNATGAQAALTAGLWEGTSAITSIKLDPTFSAGSTFTQYSTATLYGIKNS